MSYWSDVEKKARENLAVRPFVDAYPNRELFARWLVNCSDTARSVICRNEELKDASVCGQ